GRARRRRATCRARAFSALRQALDERPERVPSVLEVVEHVEGSAGGGEEDDVARASDGPRLCHGVGEGGLSAHGDALALEGGGDGGGIRADEERVAYVPPRGPG